MKPPMRRTLTGPFAVQEAGGGLWALTAGGSAAVQLYLRVPAGVNCGALKERGITRLDLQWHAERVTVRVIGAAGAVEFEAATALIHEPQNRLYDGLPLAAFDGKARRFWRRVFLLIRIPGGRHLLRWIARRRR
jgi:hypothetical protein